jgi:hypothetical protein
MMDKGEIDKLLGKLDAIENSIDKNPKLTQEEKDALKDDLLALRRLTRGRKNAGPDEALPAEFKERMGSLKRKYESLAKEPTPDEMKKLRQLLANKNYLDELKRQLRQTQQDMAAGGG